jgi:ABC-type multidrug transport system ATPase subunit
VTQTLDDAEEYCDKVAVMIDGSLVEFGSIKQLFEKYSASYTLRVFPPEHPDLHDDDGV